MTSRSRVRGTRVPRQEDFRTAPRHRWRRSLRRPAAAYLAREPGAPPEKRSTRRPRWDAGSTYARRCGCVRGIELDRGARLADSTTRSARHVDDHRPLAALTPGVGA